MRFLQRLAAVLALSVAAPAAAEWHEAKSKHFIIYADLDPVRLKAFADRLERFDQAVRKIRAMPDPDLTDGGRLTIYTLRSEEAVGRLYGRQSVSGGYFARASGSLAFVPRPTGGSSKFDLDAETIFFHEYAHHLQLQDASIALPAWLREGFAEFFSTARVEKDGSVVVGLPAQHRAYSLLYVRGLRIEDLFTGKLRRTDSAEMDRFYARGWLLTHFLSFSQERKGQLANYVEAIQAGMAPIDAAKKGFGDLRLLDRQLDDYVRGKFTAVTVAAASLNVPPVQVRKMTAGEAAIMGVRIRSKFGVDGKTAPPVANDARRIAQAYPADPFVQATLAEAEHDASNFAAADAAADRALAVNPNNVHALIYKGRVALALAAKEPSKADWTDVRKWFLRANRLDTENPEPLLLYYYTFQAAGQQPPKSAVEGLLYAVDLAPQAQETRFLAVLQLLKDKQTKAARERFVPLAYNPHGSDEWKDRAVKVMAAMQKDDAAAALALLQAPASGGQSSAN